MTAPATEKKKIPPKPQLVQPQKKKKKNAPDAPQPKWLFPPDEENPVLNPKAKTPEEIQTEREERENSLAYMKRRVHAAPDRPAPPPELLTLVGIFLTDFGFNSTSRLFTNERKARRELNGWEDAIGQKIEKGTPTLESIYREWYRDWKAQRLLMDETSSSESGSDSSDSESEAGVATQTNGVDSGDEDSDASSDGLGGSDVEMTEAPKARSKKSKAEKKTAVSSSNSSSSDSDADDEAEKKATKAQKSKSQRNKAGIESKITPAKPTVATMMNKLKRKAPSSEEDSDSDSSESPEDEQPAKRTKTSAAAAAATIEVASVPNGVSSDPSSELEDSEAGPAAAKGNAEDTSDSSSESSDSNSEEDPKPTKMVPSIPKAASDSSATVNGDVKKPVMSASESGSSSSSATSTSESDKAPAKAPAVNRQKHAGAKPTPLAELSAKGIQGHVSNQYQSYEYADKAYQDLSVTRGKGFTKEKNKKKRGSYRGGAIDTSGGKGFKFED